MSEPQVTHDDSQKTVVSFIFGLLIGGLLVWAFMGGDGAAPAEKVEDAAADKKEQMEEAKEEVKENVEEAKEEVNEAAKKAELPIGEGLKDIGNQKAGMSIAIPNATFPIKEGWVGVRDYSDDRMGPILGVVRFSEAQGLVPSAIVLQRPTIAGKQYAIVYFSEDGDRVFNSATDIQAQTPLSLFTAE